MIRTFGGLLLLCLAVAPASGQPDPASPIVKGDEPNQFDLVGIGPESIRIEGGEVRLSGRPFGYFATKARYQDFALTFEWMFERPDDLADDARFRGNGGVILQVEPPLRVWPKGVEVQLAQVDPGAIFPLGDVGCEAKSDPEAQKRATRPVGRWNRSEITSRRGTIVSVLNGVEVARGSLTAPVRGPIAWKSEGKPIRFRNLAIRPLD